MRAPVFRPLLALVVVVLAVVACDDPTSVDPADTLVFVEGATLEEIGDGEVAVVIPVVIRNTTSLPVDYHSCGEAISRVEPARPPRTVWSPLCVLIATPPLRLEPGEEHAFTLEFRGQPGEGSFEFWDAPIAGRYQVRAFLSGRFGQLSGRKQTSAAFTLD